ncbi:MC1R [Mytilus coruscus]|uniref:MC1R n=1 Tax=Mytilus coruscus TaxID=42192 RepID=A0A6J8BWL8_MYTCO|nr:MC1R [Mytilus coruscus]
MGIEIIYGSILFLQNSHGNAYLYQCMAINHIVAGTVLASQFHTLMICLERLSATFISKPRILHYVTSNVSVILCFVVINGFALLRFGLDTLNGTFPCDQRYTATTSFLFSHDIPAVIILILVVLCYGITINRMMKQRKTIGIQTVRNVEIPIDNRSKKNTRMCKNVIILGAIIGLTLVATLPRSIAVFFSYSVGGSESALNFVWIANHVFVLLNPLFDPLIYAFTVRQYREHLISFCKCFQKPQ